MHTAQQALLDAQAVQARRPADHGQGWPFYRRKAERTEHYLKYEFGWKLKTCTACSGSGYYDNDGSPDCGSCDGTGKERYAGEKSLEATRTKAA